MDYLKYLRLLDYGLPLPWSTDASAVCECGALPAAGQEHQRPCPYLDACDELAQDAAG